MEGGATATVSLDSISTTQASRSEKVFNLLNELAKTFAKFWEMLFAVITFAVTMSTDNGRSLLMTCHLKVLALVFMVVLYFLTLILGTMLQQLQYPMSLLPILLVINLSQGCAVSVLALTMISTPIAWIAFALWLFIFALVGYYNRQELYQMIPNRIKDLIGGGTGMSSQPTIQRCMAV